MTILQIKVILPTSEADARRVAVTKLKTRPNTSSVTQSLTRVTFAPRSPTVLHFSGARKSPRKTVLWTPKRNSANYRHLGARSGRNPPFVSPSLAIRTPLTQTGTGMKAFLLPRPHSVLCDPRHYKIRCQEVRSRGFCDYESSRARLESLMISLTPRLACGSLRRKHG